VLEPGANRIQVEVFDEAGQATAQGWVDVTMAAPSAPGTGWLVNTQPTPLLEAARAEAPVTRSLPLHSPLQQTGNAVDGYVPVRLYSADFSRVLGAGWVLHEATGPAYAPSVRVRADSGASTALAEPVQQQDLIETVGAAARLLARQTGVPASVTIAQAVLESDWGRSQLARQANNYWGVKALGRPGDAGVIWLPTLEYDAEGNTFEELAPFRAYSDLMEALRDHHRLLVELPRYRAAMAVASDPRAFARKIAEGGYATDPAYASKLIALMERYDLFRYDR
jgi:hypothetical protein